MKLSLPHTRKACQWLLNFHYRVPNPLSSFEEWERFINRDLLGFSLPELRREKARLKYRLLLDDNPPKWLVKRLYAIDEALCGQ